jgi:uncharacterized membrane protein
MADRAGLVAVIVLALLARFHSITVPVIWYDEAYSILLAEGSPAYIWATTARDVHPPLYYVLLHLWMLLFGNGVLAARSLSALRHCCWHCYRYRCAIARKCECTPCSAFG